MNAHGQEVPEVEKRTDHLILQIILMCWSANYE